MKITIEATPKELVEFAILPAKKDLQELTLEINVNELGKFTFNSLNELTEYSKHQALKKQKN